MDEATAGAGLNPPLPSPHPLLTIFSFIKKGNVEMIKR